MNFRVGQMVMCIAAIASDDVIPNVPTKGRIYTVRDIAISPLTGREGLWVEEIINQIHAYGPPIGAREPGFYSENFRPVKETSIEIFRKLVSPVDGVSA